ncbi:unnamed protein product [Trichogramma brassicae]|uniref:Uncharacterized protein n=1 Tax=Trichogramma brassicae TaxID=86971 RepID=A0A6H5ITG8_9HYME|nr:unnamed protein product [Trichogramma brassicae]
MRSLRDLPKRSGALFFAKLFLSARGQSTRVTYTARVYIKRPQQHGSADRSNSVARASLYRLRHSLCSSEQRARETECTFLSWPFGLRRWRHDRGGQIHEAGVALGRRGGGLRGAELHRTHERFLRHAQSSVPLGSLRSRKLARNFAREITSYEFVRAATAAAAAVYIRIKKHQRAARKPKQRQNEKKKKRRTHALDANLDLERTAAAAADAVWPKRRRRRRRGELCDRMSRVHERPSIIIHTRSMSAASGGSGVCCLARKLRRCVILIAIAVFCYIHTCIRSAIRLTDAPEDEIQPEQPLENNDLVNFPIGHHPTSMSVGEDECKNFICRAALLLKMVMRLSTTEVTSSLRGQLHDKIRKSVGAVRSFFLASLYRSRYLLPNSHYCGGDLATINKTIENTVRRSNAMLWTRRVVEALDTVYAYHAQ